MSSENTESLKFVGYSWQVGFAYVFNLIVGAGLLALPKAFSETGWLLGIIALSILATVSYITVTFTVESMAIANAVLRYNSEKKKALGCYEKDATVVFQINAALEDEQTENPNACKTDSVVTPTATPDSENTDTCKAEPDVKTTYGAISLKYHEVNKSQAELNLKKGINTDHDTYEITENMELGEMSRMFFPKVGVLLYYVAMCLYSYGCLSIYACAIAKSLTTVVCGDTKCFDGNVTLPCRNVRQMSVLYMYRIMVGAVALFVCPLAYFDIKSTKVLQIFTTTYRWVSMITMIILAVIKIANGEGKSTPNLFVFSNLPNFFGVAVFAFMCQHSIPAVLTPVNNKKRLNLLVTLDFILVIVFYSTILLTAVYAFPQGELQDLYTLNFVQPHFFKYFLQLFPVFTIAASFPILAIVLQNNLKTVLLTNTAKKDYGIFLNRILFPSIVVIPPIVVVYNTFNVGMLVGYTGTYAGAVLQYVIPAMLVYCGRRKMTLMFGMYKNKYQSPFRHQFWIYLVMLWYAVCLVFVTYNKIKGH